MMEKKKQARKSVLILTLITVLSFLIALATAIGGFAAYTNSRNAQRTPATYESNNERFSSNILLNVPSRTNVKTLYVTDASIAPSSVITVCNYERGKQTLPYQAAIPYSLTVRFVKYDASTEEKYVPVDSQYFSDNLYSAYNVTISKGLTTVTLNSSHVSDSSFSGTLTAAVANSDAYTLSFSKNFVLGQPNLYVEMIVIPNVAGLTRLYGIFKTDLRAQGAQNYWTGEFNDDTSVAPSGYDGFNYLVQGIGALTVTIEWDDTKVSISDRSLEELLAITGATKVGSSITFPVDSDVTARYDLQFYKVNITNETWADMNNDVVWFTHT